jgi:hypothetical protein
MGGGNRRPPPALALGAAARKAVPLLRPLSADATVHHASNYAIVANQVQNKMKKK